MTSKLHPNYPRQNPTPGIIYEVVRPQRKMLSRYKLKKQSTIIERILEDPQIMGDEVKA